MANKRIIELQERTQLDMNDWLIVDSSTSTRKLSMSTLFAYMTMTSMIFVTELPTEDISTSTIYLLPHTGSSTQWDEYIYRDDEWVLIGTSTIDLSAIYQTVANATAQNQDIPWYGTCSTAAGTTAKVATTADTKLGALAAGQKVKIKFTNANTASAPTLNVDSKGAASIKAYNTTAPTVWWKAGDTVEFTYDGTNWIMSPTQGQIEDINTAVTELKAFTNGSTYVRTHTYAITRTIAAGGHDTLGFTADEITGMTPILAVFQENDSSYTLIPMTCSKVPNANRQFTFSVVNIGSTDVDHGNVTANVIYINNRVL